MNAKNKKYSIAVIITATWIVINTITYVTLGDIGLVVANLVVMAVLFFGRSYLSKALVVFVPMVLFSLLTSCSRTKTSIDDVFIVDEISSTSNKKIVYYRVVCKDIEEPNENNFIFFKQDSIGKYLCGDTVLMVKK